MRAIILVLLAAAIGLGVLASQQAATIKLLQAGMLTATEQIKTGTLAQQERCSKQAERWFDQQGYTVNELPSYTNHYNVRLNLCMVTLKHRFIAAGFYLEFESVNNAFENKQVANYVRRVQGDDDVPPTHCAVENTAGQVQGCKSAKEFRELTKVYTAG